MGFLNALRGQLTRPAQPVAAPGEKPMGGLLGQAGTMAPAAPPQNPSMGVLGGAMGANLAQPIANTNVRTLTPPPTTGPFGGRMGSPLGVSNPMPTGASNPRPTGFLARFKRR